MIAKERVLNQHYAKCPFCGHEGKDPWELSDSGETTCGECGKGFWYERELVAWFTTAAIRRRK